MTDEGTGWGEQTEGTKGNREWKLLGVSTDSTQVRVLVSKAHKPGPESELHLESLIATELVDGRVYWHTGKPSSSTDYPAYQVLSVDFANPDEPHHEGRDTDTSVRWKHGVLATNLKPNDDGSPVAQAITPYVPGADRQEILRLEKLQSNGQGLELLGADDRGTAVFYDGDLFLLDPETRSSEMIPGPYESGFSGFALCGPKVS